MRDTGGLRIGRYGAAVLGVVLLALGLGLGGCGAKSNPDTAPPAAPWEVGSCVYQVAGPTAIPTDLNEAGRTILLGRQQFQAVACSDPHATVKIIALGAKSDAVGDIKGDTGCPDTTDAVYRNGGLPGGPVICGRNLVAPHPGDPGGGGGPKIIVGDCVGVGASGTVGVTNVSEYPCDRKDGYFAQVLARVGSVAECTAAGTISRLPGPDGAVLCLGQGGAGHIAAAGNCVIRRTDLAIPITRTACAGDTDTVTGFAATQDACPGKVGEFSSGYDRVLCFHRP